MFCSELLSVCLMMSSYTPPYDTIPTRLYSSTTCTATIIVGSRRLHLGVADNIVAVNGRREIGGSGDRGVRPR